MSSKNKTAVREYFYFRSSVDSIGMESKVVGSILESFSIEQLKEVPVDIGIIDRWVNDLRRKLSQLME